MFAHPVEHALANVLPLFAGPALLQSHPVTTALWLWLALTTTLVMHSGYRLPLLPSNDGHDFHHEVGACVHKWEMSHVLVMVLPPPRLQRFTSNFGVLGVLDAFAGTSGGHAEKSH